MPVKMQPTSTIKANLGIEPGGRVHKYFTSRCRDHMDKYVPMADGHLRDSAYSTNYTDKIVYSTPYAHYIYSGELYVDPETGSSWAKKDSIKVPTGKPLFYHTPGTGPYWDKKMVSAEMQEICKEVENYIRSGK